MFRLFKKREVTNQEDAIKKYNEMRRVLSGIINTDGFKALVEWWETEYEALEDKIAQSNDPEEVFRLTRERKIIKKHYLFMKYLHEGNVSSGGR